MEKKVADIADAFQNYRFQDALRQIDQLMKKISKQDTKKKNNNALNEKEEKVVMIIKVGALAATGHVHQANSLIKSYFNQKTIQTITPDQFFLFFSMGELCNDDRMSTHVETYMKKLNNPQRRLERFMLNHRMFSNISKIYLKQFVTQKKQEDGFAQIYIQYLSEINKSQAIEKCYKFNPIIKPNKKLNLKMVELFFMKYLSGLKIQEIKNKKLIYSINDLKLRLAIHGQKAEQAMKIYLKQVQNISEPFTYLRSIRQLYENNQQVQKRVVYNCYKFYLVNAGNIFKKNTSIQKYTPYYDFYNQFLQFLLSKIEINSFKTIGQNLVQNSIQHKLQDLYNFYTFQDGQFSKYLIHYYQSLFSEYKHLIDIDGTYKKSDYYKISVKGLLLQMIKIHYQVFTRGQNLSVKLSQNKVFNYLLKQYFDLFSKTLTYPQQMSTYLQHLSEIFKEISSTQLPHKFDKKDDNLILLINKSKIQQILDSNCKNTQTFEQIVQKIKINWTQYNKYVQEVQNRVKLQKGERYLSDEFILLSSDILIKFVQQKQDLSEQVRELLLKKIMAILSQTTQVSPYNSDLKLRLLYVCNKLNYFDKLADTFLSMDIKSVQFQTLGHYLLHPIQYFSLYAQFQNVVTKMVRSYQQNQRQTSQYAIKALKAGASHQVFQFFAYQKRIDKSFSKLQLYLTLYKQYKNEASSIFYLNHIKNIIDQRYKNNQKLAFNCDIATMKNILFRNSTQKDVQQNHGGIYNQFYGILSSTQVLKFDVQLKLQQYQLKAYVQNFTNKQFNYKNNLQNVQLMLKNINEQIKNVRQLFSLQQFDLLQTFLGKTEQHKIDNKGCNKNKNSLKNDVLKTQLKIYVQVNLVKILAMRLIQNIVSLFSTEDKQMQNKVNEWKVQRAGLFESLKKLQQMIQLLAWRMQIKLIGQLRVNLSQILSYFTHCGQEISKHKKISKPVKNLLNETSQELTDIVIKLMTQIKMSKKLTSQNLKLKEILAQINCQELQKKDQVLQRLNKMDMKQAKKLLSK